MVDNIKIENQKSNIPNIPNVEFQEAMSPFVGMWQPSIDSILIGFNNYKVLENMRYKKDESGIEGIQGYSKFNTNAVGYTIDTGIHLQTSRDNDSYLLVHGSVSNSGTILISTSTIGEGSGNGTFLTNFSTITENTLTVGNPRFGKSPGGTVMYCNEYISEMFSGFYVSVGSALQIEQSANSSIIGYFEDGNSQGWGFPEDITEIISNQDTTDEITFTTADKQGILIFSTRALQGITVSIVSGTENTNSANTTINVQYYKSSYAFDDCTNISDGTSNMTQSGTISFDSTEVSAIPYHYDNKYLFTYLLSMEASSGTSSCDIYEITTVPTVQKINNVWDGIYRQPVQVQIYDATNETYRDFTLHVNESSTEQTPVGLYLGQVTSSERIYIMFNEQISGIQFQMLGSLVNTADSQISLVGYWNGTNFTNVNYSTMVDRTLDDTGDSSFGKTGLISWAPPTNEQKTSLFGVTGYAYIFAVDGTISGTNPEDVVVDLIGGIPAIVDIKTYSFATTFKERLFMCGYILGNEKNRIDYSITNSPDVFNGYDSSNNGLQSIYVGSNDGLTAGVQLYNRFGSNIYSVLVLTKNNETWLLIGDGPEDFQLYPISFNIGCPAWDSLITAEVGFSIGENIERNVAMWISQQGPVMFDGAVLNPIKGIETYFDPASSNYITVSALYKTKSWFDINYHEWNILLPTAESTELNTWLVYNIRQHKWFAKNVNGNANILFAIPSVASSGYRYIYGGADDQRLYLLESGNSWSDNAITYKVQSGDYFPSDNPWDLTLLRHCKLVVKLFDTPNTNLNVSIYTNTSSTASQTKTISIGNVCSVTGNCNVGEVCVSNVCVPSSILVGTTILKYDTGLNEIGWCHSIGLEMTSNSAPKGFEPIMIGYRYQNTRKDI